MNVVTGTTKREFLNCQSDKMKSSTPLCCRVALWHVFQKFQLESGKAYRLNIEIL